MMGEGGRDMKMILAILSSEDAETATEAMLEAGFGVTAMATLGGFLRRQYVTLLIGTEEEKVDQALALIKANSRPHRARLPLSAGLGTQEIGAATIFVLDVEALHHY
jgi:uncharacterized protein YaaQ